MESREKQDRAYIAGLTHLLVILLLPTGRGTHRVRFPRPRLAVCENGDVITLRESIDTVLDVIPYPLLVRVFSKDSVEDEEFSPLGRFDGEARRCRRANHRSLVSLWDQFEARIRWSQGRAHAYS